MTSRETVISIIKNIIPNAYSAVAPDEPAAPYAVLKDEGTPREELSSGGFEYEEARIDLYFSGRGQGKAAQRDLIEALNAHAVDFDIVAQGAGADYDDEEKLHIFAITLSVYVK